MKKFLMTLIFVLSIFLLSAQFNNLSIWTNIRNSSYTIDDSLYIRCETVELPGLETELYYFDGTIWQNTAMNNYQNLTYEAVIPALNGGAENCRFRTATDTLVAMMPARIPNDVFPPAAAEMSLVDPDSTGDNLVPAYTNLDITGNYFGYSDTRFYSGTTNASGSFPLNGGGLFPTTYFFYATIIINPENVLIDSVAYALVYGNVPLFLPQGLYRINGTGLSLESLVQIGSIEAQVVNGQLITACDISTLTSDEYFGTWPSISNSLIVEMATAVYSLPETFTLADYSHFSLQFIDQYVIEPFTNVLPEISNIDYSTGTATTTVWFTYSDENGNFPLTANLLVGNDTYQMQPLTFDYSQPVIFETTFPNVAWNEATITVSDNDYEFVEETFQNGNYTSPNNLVESNCRLSNYPNPFNPSTTISFDLTAKDAKSAKVEIYNIRGQKIKTLDCCNSFAAASKELSYSKTVVWDGTDSNNKPVSSGVYFYKLKAGDFEKTRKMLLMK
ncbi:MAG TPA: T9SS type A sorting domain-containing protein [Candidatus Cloacimonadota bacterium]|nr:T9SS type A sorting domain-containing protein [Candidatus Cloacimonadota bacterium]